jgi:cystathionine beta-lyase
VAQWLQQQPQVARTFYPALPDDPGHTLWKRDFAGASGLVSFALKGGDHAAASRLVNALRLFAIGASWGGYESLALVAPPERLNASRSWREHGNDAPVIRLHIGLEDPHDLIADLRQAFQHTVA